MYKAKSKTIAEAYVLIILALACKQTDKTVVSPPKNYEQVHGSFCKNSSSAAFTGVHISWKKNRESDLAGYRIFRRCRPYEPDSDLPWTNWGLLVEKYSPVDTTHLDKTVKNQYEYEYKITAFDSLGNESKFSNTRRRRVCPQKEE